MASENDRTDADYSVEWAKCYADAAYFIDTYGIIDDAQGHGDGSGVMPFRLWPAQLPVVDTLQHERFIVILKARQLGISWICVAYALWKCLFNAGQVGLLFSQGKDEATELLRRIRVLYERLPDWLKEKCPLDGEPNLSRISWQNGSRCLSLPATERAGRSYTASFVMMDEAAYLLYGEKLLSSTKATAEAGGQIVILSTANGPAGMFYNVFKSAWAGKTRYKAVFLPWWSRPGRDAKWYETQVTEETYQGETKQEYPSNPTEAFLASGNTRFNSEWVDAQADNIRDPIPRHELPEALRKIDGLSVYVLPGQHMGTSPILACDVAEGLENGDFSAFPVIDNITLEELACYHGLCEPDELAGIAAEVRRIYGGTIVVERNNHGHAVLLKLRQIPDAIIAIGPDGKDGWLSNTKYKPQAVDALASALRDGSVVIHSDATVTEMKEYKKLANGRTGAPKGKHDDRVMSWAVGLGWWMLCGQATGGVIRLENPFAGRRW